MSPQPKPQSHAAALPGSPIAVMVAVLVAVLVLSTLPAAAVTLSGSVHSGNAQNSRRSAEVGPRNLGVEWQTGAADTGGYVVGGIEAGTGGGAYGMVLAGDVLVATATRDDDSSQQALLAFDQATGDVTWTLEGHGGGCKPAVDGDGTVWAFSTGSPITLTAIDPATGAVDPARQVADLDGQGTAPDGCVHGIHIASNGLVVWDDSFFDDQIVAVDPADGSIAWVTDLPGTSSGLVMTDPTTGDLVTIASPNQQAEIVVIDPDTGAITGGGPLPVGEAINRQATFIDDGGGLVVQLYPILLTQDVATLARVDLATMSIEWTREDQPEDLDGNFASLALGGVAGDLAVGWIGGGRLTAIRLGDGATAWEAELPGFGDTASIHVGADGVIYTTLFGPSAPDGETLIAVAPDGALISAIGEDEAGPGFSVDAIADGRLFALTAGAGGTVWIALTDTGQEIVLPGEPGVGRIDGEDTIGSICQVQQPDPDSAASVLIARRDNFADALAGSALAGTDSCILFTTGGPDATLDPGTRAELDRVLADGGLVRILGGTAAISTPVEAELAAAGYDVERFAGASRYETALLIARQVRAENPGNADAMLAFAGNWPDAVTGGAYAAATGTPILLTDPGATHPTALQGAAELGVTRTFVLGGSAVIGDAAANGMPGPVRVAGDNRMATAVATATQLWGPLLGGQAPASFTVVNLERDDSYSLALAAAPLSAKLGGPQLGVGQGRLPAETQGYLAGIGFSQLPAAVLIGDVGIIDDGTASAIEGTIQP